MPRFLSRLLPRLVVLLVAPVLAFAVGAAAPAKKTETAIFSGGCFWCMEHDMKLPGVISVESGYTGGTLKNPHYEDVLTERTGHYESVRVTYDPERLPYAALVNRYWKLVDPTDEGGQFCDRGPSYKTAVFVNSPDQRRIAEASRAEAAKALKIGKMTTQILDAKEFYPAEEYHRDYAVRNAGAYQRYRMGCGRDARLAVVWGRG